MFQLIAYDPDLDVTAEGAVFATLEEVLTAITELVEELEDEAPMLYYRHI